MEKEGYLLYVTIYINNVYWSCFGILGFQKYLEMGKLAFIEQLLTKFDKFYVSVNMGQVH